MAITRRRMLVGSCAWCGDALASTLAVPASSTPATPRFARNTLFVITRSKNANVVYYDLRVGPKGIRSRTDPLDVYWRMYAQKGEREELTWAERKFAYGYELISSVEASGFRARLTALPKRPIEVWRQEKSKFVASCSIAGKVGILRQVHVVTIERWTGAVVQYIEIVGVDVKTQQPLRERIEGG